VSEEDRANMRMLMAGLMLHALVSKDQGSARIERMVATAFELADEFVKRAEAM
jgi:hypothetical protein